MLSRYLFKVLFLLLGISLSCSGSSSSTAPDIHQDDALANFQPAGNDSNTIVFGVWQVIIDPETETAEIIPVRNLDQHFNVTAILLPPKCTTCFKIQNLSYNSTTQVVTLDVGFENPSNLTGYDVRGIVTEFGNMTFVNPDGYTMLFTDVPGKLNPFMAFKTGPGNRSFLPHTVQYFTMQIHNPSFPQFAQFKFVVEASWPDNCKEPYEVKLQGLSGSLFSDGSNSVQLRVYARDWQSDIAEVTVNLSPVGGSTVSFIQDVLPEVWRASISAASGTPIGPYKLLVKATTSSPYNQTADMYNYVNVQVIVPPVPGAEVFNFAERVSNTPGESFIWPRHAIATTSDGISHAVFVDNMPDPASNIFHVYYVNRAGGMWNTPVMIDTAQGRAKYATIAADSADVLHIVWEDERDHLLGSDIYYTNSVTNFTVKSVIVTGADGYRNVYPRIAAGDDNSLHIAWHSLELIDIGDYEYNLWYMAKGSGSPSWDAPVLVSGTDDIAEAYPAIAVSSTGKAFIAYQSDEAGPHAIMFTENTSGSFSTPVQATVSEAFQPALDVTPGGTLVLAYFDKVDGTYSDIFVRLSNDTGATWSSPIPISTSNDDYQVAPDVEVSQDGDFHVAWHEEDDEGRPGRLLYRELLNGNPSWQDIQELVIESGSAAFPSMDSDASSHIHILYQQFTPFAPPDEDNYDIWYRSSATE